MKRSKKIVYNFTPYIKVYKENFSNRYLKKKNFHKIILQDSAMVILKNKKNEILFLNEYRRGIKKKSLGFPGGHIEKNEKPYFGSDFKELPVCYYMLSRNKKNLLNFNFY